MMKIDKNGNNEKMKIDCAYAFGQMYTDPW